MSGAQASHAAPPVAVDHLEHFCRAALRAAGADETSVDAASRAMMHGSVHGIDSHGIRLLPHYVRALIGGRINPKPRLAVVAEAGAVATLDADHGHGAIGAYAAMDQAIRLAGRHGIGAVAVRNTSHFGPAGAFVLPAAEARMIGLAMCNSDSAVRLHDGATKFHGTNPIACAAPVEGDRPWLFDMATSAIPYNRVELYRTLGRTLPPGTASQADGRDTEDPGEVAMLAPLGAAFGFKGAGLAGLAEILSATLSGMRLSFEIPPMGGPDFSQPRRLGAFVVAIRPGAFLPQADFDEAMRRYLSALRASPARAGAVVMAPGDREWAEADRRRRSGVPIDPGTLAELGALAEQLGIEPVDRVTP